MRRTVVNRGRASLPGSIVERKSPGFSLLVENGPGFGTFPGPVKAW